VIFNYYQQLIKLRKSEKLISDGHFTHLIPDHPQVFAYERWLDDSNEKLLVFVNFYDKETTVTLPKEFVGQTGQVLISNFQQNVDSSKLSTDLKLAPYEAVAYKLQ